MRLLHALVLITLAFLTYETKGVAPDWDSGDYSEYDYSMLVLGQVETDELEEITAESDLISAWYGSEQRGYAQSGALGSKYYFLITVFSDLSTGEEISLQFYDASSDTERDICASFTFVDGDVLGSPVSPYGMTQCATGLFIDFTFNKTPQPEAYERDSGFAYPNPFVSELNLDVPHASAIRIYNEAGEIIDQEIPLTETITIATSSWQPGLYLIEKVGEDRNYYVRIVKE
jgi:hypothetical protein